jgi:hypothetical protein
MSLIKLTIQGGAHSNMPNTWHNSKKLGTKGNVPLAQGLNSSLLPIPKLS